jgi:Protein kinase domain
VDRGRSTFRLAALRHPRASLIIQREETGGTPLAQGTGHLSHTSSENRVPTKEILLPGQEFCIGLPWERERLPAQGLPPPMPPAHKGNALDARVLESDPCAGWEIGPCTVIRRLSPGSAKTLLAVRESKEEGEAVVVMRRIELAEVLAVEVQTNARWAAQFRHQNLARVYDCEVSDEGIFWVTALASGAIFGEIFAACKQSGRGIPVGLAISTITEAARGLAELHRAGGFAHALVSDQSVSVGFDGTARLSDAGLFRCIARKATWADFLESMGPYLAPEQVLEGHMPDPKCDVFSLAVVLYECLSGEKVLRTKDFEARVKAHQKKLFKPISSLNMALGTSLDAVMAKALSADRAQRYPSAAEFARALAQAGSGFMWQGSQREKFVTNLFPDRLRREQVLLDSASPEVRPKLPPRRIPTQPALKVVIPPPLPPRPKVPVTRFAPSPPPLPVSAKPPALPQARVEKVKAKGPPSKWRAFFLFLALLGTGAAWVYQSGLTARQVDHALWKVIKNVPTPEQLQERVKAALDR